MPCEDCSRAEKCPPCVNEPEGSASSSPDECASPSGQHCWHYRSEIPGDECCVCEKRQLDDPPADAETAGEPECSHESWEVYGTWRKCADCRHEWDEPEAPTTAQEATMQELTDLRQEMEAIELKVPEEPLCHSCGQRAGTWFDRSVCAEPCGSMHDRCSNCGAVTGDACLNEAPTEPPRRPPYAVAYATEGGAQYEIALPGDATIRAHEGALIITHASAVLALTQARPMEGA